MGEGFPRLEGSLGAPIGGEEAQRFPFPITWESLPGSEGPIPSEVPSGPGWSWGRRREGTGEAGGRAPPGPEEQRKGVEGVCPTHSGSGSLLGSPPPSKATSRQRGPWGHRRRAGRSGEAGGRGPPGREKQKRSGGRLPGSLLRWGRPPSETRRGVRHAWASSTLLSLSPTPHTPQGVFQPCGS